MVRLLFALPFALLSLPAWGQNIPIIEEPDRALAASQAGNRAGQANPFKMPIGSESSTPDSHPFATTEIAPNARFGIGMFGYKQERFGMAPTTVREVNSPRTRRAGVGFSLKF